MPFNFLFPTIFSFSVFMIQNIKIEENYVQNFIQNKIAFRIHLFFHASAGLCVCFIYLNLSCLSFIFYLFIFFFLGTRYQLFYANVADEIFPLIYFFENFIFIINTSCNIGKLKKKTFERNANILYYLFWSYSLSYSLYYTCSFATKIIFRQVFRLFVLVKCASVYQT